MTTPITLRLVPVKTARDWTDYHALRRAVLFDARGIAYNDAHPDDRARNNTPMLLVQDGQSVGAMRIDLVPGAKLAIMRTVAIEKTHRGQGLGSRMLALAEDFAREHGCTVAGLNPEPDAVAFYLKCGYEAGIWDANQLPPDGRQLKKSLQG